MRDLIRNLSFGFAAGAIGGTIVAALAMAALEVTRSGGLLLAYVMPLTIFGSPDFAFRLIVVGGLLGLLLSSRLLRHVWLRRGLAYGLAAGLAATLAVAFGMPEMLAEAGLEGWRNLAVKVAPPGLAIGLLWGVTATFWYEITH